MPFLVHYSGLNKDSFLKALKDLGFRIEPFTRYLYIIDLTSKPNEGTVLDKLSELDKDYLKNLKLEYIPSKDYLSNKENLVKALLNLNNFEKAIEQFVVTQRDEILESLYPVFQPIVDIRHFELFAFEALCRGKLPIYYLMKYAKPILDKIDWTCRERAIAKKSQEIPPNVKIFLNFFPESLQNVEEASHKLFELLEKYNVSPNEIVVEITEYAGFDVKKLKTLTREWRDLGIMIALDDIGTGEDSLFRFLEIMPDIIKIDMVFVRGIHKNKIKRDITRYLINLAHANNMLVVAEGVEEPEELKVVHELGADLVQGWLLGKPTPNPKSYVYTPWASILSRYI